MNRKLAVSLLFVVIVMLTGGCIKEELLEGPIIRSEFPEADRTNLQTFYEEVTATASCDNFETKERHLNNNDILVVGILKEENGIECLEEKKLWVSPVYAFHFSDGETYIVNGRMHMYDTNSPIGLHIYKDRGEWRIKEIVT